MRRYPVRLLRQDESHRKKTSNDDDEDEKNKKSSNDDDEDENDDIFNGNDNISNENDNEREERERDSSKREKNQGKRGSSSPLLNFNKRGGVNVNNENIDTTSPALLENTLDVMRALLADGRGRGREKFGDPAARRTEEKAMEDLEEAISYQRNQGRRKKNQDQDQDQDQDQESAAPRSPFVIGAGGWNIAALAKVLRVRVRVRVRVGVRVRCSNIQGLSPIKLCNLHFPAFCRGILLRFRVFDRILRFRVFDTEYGRNATFIGDIRISYKILYNRR